MKQITIRVVDAQKNIIASCMAEDAAELIFNRSYEQGDTVIIESSELPAMLKVSLDPAIKESTVWLADGPMEFPIPLGEAHMAYPDTAFCGEQHRITACCADKDSIYGYGLISENPLDRRGDTHYYPHCTANAETRGESVFAARNVIDGSLANTSHGIWPYTSWGEDENPDARIRIDFGRKVLADKTAILIRADFPHDNYWTSATMEFSDGTEIRLPLVKTGEFQTFDFPAREVTWVMLKNFVRGDDPSPFPALSEWEVYGRTV